MEFRVLGPVAVIDDDGRPVEVGGRKEKCVLAALLLAGGKPVSTDRLCECVWGDELPAKARETLHAYISRLRKHLRAVGLDPSVLGTSAMQGYRIAVPDEDVDARRFDRLARRAENLAGQRPEEAVRLLHEAVSMFDGEPLAGISGDWAQATRLRFMERQRAAVFARIEIELRLGRHDRLIGELTELAARSPVDQSAVSLLMSALNSAGRTAEALTAYQQARTRLRETIGFEPRKALQDLHQAILRGEPAPMGATAPDENPVPPSRTAQPRAPDTLGPEPDDLIGRDDDLRVLLSYTAADLRADRPVSVLALDGMAGVGKTTLALLAAHRLADRCPGGRLRLNLRGHDPRQPPMEAAEALASLLAMAGVPAAELGRLSAQDALAALWRSRTADGCMLLLLDDASSAEQIRPLMPAGSGNVVIITTRLRMTGLDRSCSRSVSTLPPGQAAALFSRRAGTERIDEPGRAEEIARLCGGLPLALVVAAGHLRSRPAWRLRDLAERMAYARAKPDEGDQIGQPVNAAFALSYRALTESQGRLFRLLGLHQGSEISLHAAAALHDGPTAETDRALDVLVGHHLLEEPRRHHYRMHDLIRDYAAQRAHYEEGDEGRAAAVLRLLNFYVFSADLAERTIQPHHRDTLPATRATPRALPPISTAAEAQAWLDGEHENLMAAIRYAADHGYHRHATRLPHILAQHLDRQCHWKQAVEVHETALGAAHALGDKAGQATALTDLGAAHWQIGDLERALVCAEAALRYWRELGDRAGESDALFELGRIHWHARRPDQAARDLRESASLRARAKDPRGVAVAVYHLSIVMFELGRHTDAVVYMTDALQTAEEIHDETTARDCLTNLGVIYQRLGRYDEARTCYERAVGLARVLGSEHRLAVLANNIGEIHVHQGDHEEALESFRAALETYERLGDRRSQIDTLSNAADAYQHLGRFQDAVEQLTRADVLANQVGDPLLRARVQQTFGEFHVQRREHTEALRAFRAALAQARRAAAPLEQATALERVGDTLAALGKVDEALVQWRYALALFEELDLPEADRLRRRLRENEAERRQPDDSS